MNEFTFISITYNHEKYILDHLESIKEFISKYGKNVRFDYICSDDSSKDNTIKIVEHWISKNRNIFNRISILKSEENRGTVRNILRAVDNVKTENFKFLAGDDCFNSCQNFLDLYSNLGPNEVILTRVIPFSYEQGRRPFWQDFCFDIDKEFIDKNKFGALIGIGNFIAAPGVFMSGNLMKEKDVRDFLLSFNIIEDYPLWFFLVNKCGVNISYRDVSYIKYRVGSGNSTKDRKNRNSAYDKDLKRIQEIINPKLYSIPKFINPYRYWLKYRLYKYRKDINKNG